MNTNEETLYGNEQTIQNTNTNEFEQQPVQEEEKKKGGNAALRAAAVVGGAALGVGSAVAATKLFTQNGEEEAAETPEMSVAETNDDMTFEEAFNTARAQVGPGGAFRWHGGIYSTYTEEEWNNLSEEERNAFQDRIEGVATGSETDPSTYENNAHTEHATDPNVHKASLTDDDSPKPIGMPAPPSPLEFDLDTSTETRTEVNGQNVIVAQGTYDGHAAAYIDSDLDGKYDLVIVDSNDNGDLDENDTVVDLNEEGISISVQNTKLIDEPTPSPSGELELGEPFEAEVGGQKVVAAKVTIGGREGLAVDIDRDGEYDRVIFDFNGDGEISDNEVINVEGQGLTWQSGTVTPTNNDGKQGIVIESESIQEIDGKQCIVAEGTVAGHRAAFVDFDGDGNYDRAIVDVNDDGQISENEMIDLRGQGITVQDRSLVDSFQPEDPSATDTGLDDPSDHLPDYVNDATEQGMENNGEGEDYTTDPGAYDDPNSTTDYTDDCATACDDTTGVF